MYFILLAIIYIAFISFGLPDSVLGAAWPSMYRTLGVSEGAAGIITMLIYTGTMISSMASDKIIRKLGTGNVMVLSVALTAITMYGFSINNSFLTLCLLAFPYGLGGGCVDASLNNYVALHYKARHMNFLHCFWGIGTIISPLVMGAYIEHGGIWTDGYKAIAYFQFVLVGILMLSLPLWKREKEASNETSEENNGITFKKLWAIPGVKASLGAFFCYCAIETTIGLWTTTYLSEVKAVDLVVATKCGMLFYIGIAVGRFISGFISEKWGDMKLIRVGTFLTLFALLVMLLPQANGTILYALIILAGIGCGPIFPSMVHHSPQISGSEGSQLLIGTQLAMASAGSITMPALFGLIVNHFSISLMPCFALLFTLIFILLMRNIKRTTDNGTSISIHQNSINK